MYIKKNEALVALGAAMLVAGCGSDSTNLSNQTFIGTLGDGSVVTLNLGTQSGTTIPITGTLTHVPAGGTVTLAGTYTVSNGTIVATGGSYAINGTYANGAATGTFTGPSGSHGAFVAYKGANSSVTVYCGTFGGSSSGEWNLVKNGGSVSGAYSTGKLTSGSANGYNVTFSIVDDAGGTGSGSGTINGNSISGTWTVGSATGTWSGTVCN